MWLTFLGTETQGGGSPTLYATDRDTYVVQGWRVAGKPATVVEIPETLLAHLPAATELTAALTPTGRRWQGDSGDCATYLVTGAMVEPSELAELSVPGHERCVEVGWRRGDS